MVAILKRGATKEKIKELLDSLSKKSSVKGIDAYKFCGVISLNIDALEIQKKLRDEWE